MSTYSSACLFASRQHPGRHQFSFGTSVLLLLAAFAVSATQGQDKQLPQTSVEFWDDLTTEGWFVYKSYLPGFTLQGGDGSRAEVKMIQEGPIFVGGASTYFYKVKIEDERLQTDRSGEMRITIQWHQGPYYQRINFYADLSKQAIIASRYIDQKSENYRVINSFTKDNPLMYPGTNKLELLSREIDVEKGIAYLRFGFDVPVGPEIQSMQINWAIYSSGSATSTSEVQGPQEPHEYTIGVNFGDFYSRSYIYWSVTACLWSTWLGPFGLPVTILIGPILYMYLYTAGLSALFFKWFGNIDDTRTDEQKRLLSVWNYFWTAFVQFQVTPQYLVWSTFAISVISSFTLIYTFIDYQSKQVFNVEASLFSIISFAWAIVTAGVSQIMLYDAMK